MINDEELIQVAAGEYGTVAMTPKVWKEFQNLDARVRAVLGRLFALYATHGYEDLNNKSQFPNEGTHSIGDAKGTKVNIYAFKAYAVRVYGATMSRTFVCSEIDAAKKKQKADPSKLDRAAKNLNRYYAK